MRSPSVAPRLAVAKPLYAQVRELLLSRIRDGEWAAGETLPNEFVLASQCGVSIGTIRRAIEGLEDSGIVVRKQGRGTYVTAEPASALDEKFQRLRAEDGARLALVHRLLRVERRRPRPQEVPRLQISPLAEIFEICRLVAVSDTVVGIETSCVPVALTPDLTAEALAGGLYAALSTFGILVARIEESVRFSQIGASAAAATGLGASEPALEISRAAYSIDDAVVEWRSATYRARGLAYLAAVD